MQLDDTVIKKLLIEEGYVTAEDIEAVIQTDVTPGELSAHLVAKGLITKQLLGQAIAEHFNVRFIDVSSTKIDDDIFFQIPEIVSRSQGVVALRRSEEGVMVAMLDPSLTEVIEMLEKKYKAIIIPHFALADDMQIVLKRYAANVAVQFDALVEKIKIMDSDDAERNALITQLVDVVIAAGLRNNASDIHIDPEGKHVQVRFRIDGLLHDVLMIEKSLYEYMLSRIKILAKMRTDEHRAAQDGKFRFVTETETVDIRVSVVPTTSQENVVMRLLSGLDKQIGLSDLGLCDSDLKVIQAAASHPHGMILVTGPTGSGKTTTLYAILHNLNQREVNIATIEDPVEYNITGITQIQVDARTNLTFAQGLRAIVRQDPDIIMVGEIRDEETAKIAIHSALTGHLVLSTLHTNNAATTLPRLLDMGVEIFLVASTIQVVVAQRLVRKICTSCKGSYAPNEQEKGVLTSNKHVQDLLKKIGISDIKNVRLYRGNGCKVCTQTGYAGRIGVFEVLQMTDKIRELVMQHANADQIHIQAVKQGMTTMMEDALQKMLAGETTFEEVLRVTME